MLASFVGHDNHSLFVNGGTALVIHAKPDDMKSDLGNAGDRVACGVSRVLYPGMVLLGIVKRNAIYLDQSPAGTEREAG